MSNRSRLTLVIQSFDRQKFLLRNLKYWADRGVIVHAIDGSDKPIDPTLISKFPSNIFYHHLPMSLAKRFEFSSQIVETEYVSLLADDDLFSPTGLQACVATLDNESELISCMGRTIAFGVENGVVRGWPAYDAMRGYSIIQDDSRDRMIAHMTNYTCSSIYAVTRTDAWTKAASAVAALPMKVFGIEECVFELTIALLGKSRVINDLMWLRSTEIASVIQNPMINNSEFLLFSNWWENDEFLGEREQFLEVVAGIVPNAEYYNNEIVRDDIGKAATELSSFIRMRNSSFRLRWIRTRNRLRQYVAKRVPGEFRRYINSVFVKPMRGSIIDSDRIFEELSVAGIRGSRAELTEFKVVLGDSK